MLITVLTRIAPYAWVLKFYGAALPTWTLETPVTSTCQKAHGGVVCTFTDGSGNVTLTPTDVANPDLQYVFPDRYFCEGDFQKYCAPRTTHSGTYWFPTPADDESTYGINLNITMDVNPAWLPLPADQQTTQTVSAPVCSAMSPPEPLDVQKTLRWTLSAAAQEHACTLSLTWEDAQKPGQLLTAPLTLTFQDPTGACQPQLLAPATGTVDVLARYPWEAQETTSLASIWTSRITGARTTISNRVEHVQPRISQEENWYWGPASACGDYPLCPVCAKDMYLQGRFQLPVPTVPYPPERPADVRTPPQYPAASMTWITYATVLGSSTYWTDASGGCAQLRSCANRVAPYTTVSECVTETTGYRAITTTYAVTWESTPDLHGPCERTYRRVVTPALIFSETPPSVFPAAVSVTTS